MSNVSVKREYGNEKFSNLFNTMIDKKVNEIKMKVKQEKEASYNNINYPSTNNNEVDNK